jgi:hypothetical protein
MTLLQLTITQGATPNVTRRQSGTHATGNAPEQVGSNQLDVVLPISTELVLINNLTADARTQLASRKPLMKHYHVHCVFVAAAWDAHVA